MRAVVQRVSQGRVRIDGVVVGEIQQGLLVLLGVTHNDTLEDAKRLAEKIVSLRIFNDADGKINLGVADVGGGVLIEGLDDRAPCLGDGALWVARLGGDANEDAGAGVTAHVCDQGAHFGAARQAGGDLGAGDRPLPGPGQQLLPTLGYAPLPASLDTQAKAQLDKIGTL